MKFSVFGLRYCWVALLLFSCSYKGDYKYYLDNQSNENLSIIFQLSTATDTVHVLPGENKIIRYFAGDEGLEDKGDDFLSYHGFQNIYFAPVNDTGYVSKNPKLRESWEYSTEAYGNSSKAGTNIYTIAIQDEHILY
ncbi:MAG: hypothetical protein N4A41_00765 [Crocinitomicaceae bacterium]|jgi:hypothetical protein|nr:hypothetical protein [Crocinitomicaceae bacterium]